MFIPIVRPQLSSELPCAKLHSEEQNKDCRAPKHAQRPGWGWREKVNDCFAMREKTSIKHHSDGNVHPGLVSSCSAPGPGAVSLSSLR